MDAVLPVAARILAIGLAFGLTVFAHEAGHFLAARSFGMAVYEFSIGFGRPLLFWFRRGDTQYSFRLWPFLSYVRIAGMDPGDDHPQGFDKKNRLAQALVLVTGCLMNFLLAVAIYIFMGAVIGLPVALNTIEQVVPGSPAAQVGLMPGDRMLGADGRTGLSVPQIREGIQAHPAKPMVVEVARAGRRLTLHITPQKKMAYDVQGLRMVQVPIGQIGIVFGSRLERMGTGQSVVAGFRQTYEMIGLQIIALVAMAMRTVPPEVMGPVGVVHVLYSEAKADWLRFLSMAAALTVSVGFLNLLPIPALDGSRLVIVGMEALRRKPFDKRKQQMVHLVGFALLLALAVVITYKDIIRIVHLGGE